jgi:predicted nuclease of predicted toxin-antitoxin system
LLLDECTQEPLAEAIKQCSGILSVEAITADHPLGNRSTSDKELVDYATAQKRILVTTEGRLNEKKFEICSHPGIIVIQATNRHESIKANIFVKFMRSGYRHNSKHAVTYLRLKGSLIRYRGDDGLIRELPVRIS